MEFLQRGLHLLQEIADNANGLEYLPPKPSRIDGPSSKLRYLVLIGNLRKVMRIELRQAKSSGQ